MHPSTERQLRVGLLSESTSTDGKTRLTHRTLLEASKWRITTNNEARRDVVKELFDRLARHCGVREVARVEAVIKALSSSGV